MKIPNEPHAMGATILSLARIVSEDSQLSQVFSREIGKSSKDS